MRLALVLIVALLALTTLLPDGQPLKTATTKSKGAITSNEVLPISGAATTDSTELPYDNYFRLLRLGARKKAGYTQQQADSLQNILSLRKKF